MVTPIPPVPALPRTPAPGRMSVDFEQRVDFARLREYRLGRAMAALEASDLGALLVFDNNNIRYLTGVAIGEWTRDKLCRYALYTRTGELFLWDFGSAAVHHRMYCPWLKPEHCIASYTTMRGATAPQAGLAGKAVAEIKGILEDTGVAGLPVGIDFAEIPTIFELQAAGIEVRDGQQVMLDARQLKSPDEIALLTTAAAMVDGVYQDITDALRPGVRENEIVALASKRLYEMGSDDVESINAVSGERCNPHPHNFSDRMIRPGEQAFFDIMHSFNGYRTCYYRTFSVGSSTQAQRDAYAKASEWMEAAIDGDQAGREHRPGGQALADRAGHRPAGREDRVRPAVRPRSRPRPARAPDHQQALLAGCPDGDPAGHGVRAGDLLPGQRRRFGRPARGRGRGGRRRHRDHHQVPLRGTVRHQSLLSGRAAGLPDARAPESTGQAPWMSKPHSGCTGP